MEVIPGSSRTNGNGAQVGKGGKLGNGRTKGAGRMDADKQPAVKKPKVIHDRIDELVRLHNKASEASEQAKDAITKAAEASGYLASAVRKIVTAKAGEKFEEKHREVEQQAELFDEIAK